MIVAINGKKSPVADANPATVPEASPGLKMIAANRLQWLNGQMEGREYLCGSRFTLADILLYCWLNFGGQAGQTYDTF